MYIEDNMVVIREPKILYVNLPKDVNKNFKHEIEFIIKCYESLAEQKFKNKNNQLMSKYKHGNDIQEH